MVQTSWVVAVGTHNLVVAWTNRRKHKVHNMKDVTVTLFNLDVVLMDSLQLKVPTWRGATSVQITSMVVARMS